MDSINIEAVAAMRTALTNLLPSNPPTAPPEISIDKANISLLGIGGFIDIHDDPEGEILGRKITASVTLTSVAIDRDSLLIHHNEIVDTLLSHSQGELRAQGFLKLNIDKRQNNGDNTALRKDITLNILYEYIKLPEAGEDIIEEIPTTVELE